MPGGYMFGWDDVAGGWVKVQCDANGLLTVDSSLLFENPPTEDETEKGPSSEWAFDHKANVAAHHTKYTDAEARGAINNIFGADGKADADIDMDYNKTKNLFQYDMKYSAADNHYRSMLCKINNPVIRFRASQSGVGYRDVDLEVYLTDHYVSLINEESFVTSFGLLLENPPIEDEAGKAPTSEWAFDHKANVAAHHAKYTDAEAQAACNLNGNLYWSCVGAAFGGLVPKDDAFTKSITGIITSLADGISLVAPVNLPDGAEVTNAIVRGNAGAENDTWTLYRLTLADETLVALATAAVNTADATITSPNIDNSLYGYFLLVYSVETNDEIHGSVITYTL